MAGRITAIGAGLIGFNIVCWLWALAAFRDQEITPPVLLSLAKQEEEIFLPGESESVKLSRHSFALRLLQYVRDEAHRFAQHYHHILRRKSQLGE